MAPKAEFIRHDFLAQAVYQQTGARLDAGETAALAQELEFIYAKTYDIKYPELKARKFIPVDTSVDTGAEFFSYGQWNAFGMAKIIANFADDLPMVNALKKKFTAPIHSLGASYQFSIQDTRRAAMGGSRLSDVDARAVRRAHEQSLDVIAATGNADAGLQGLLNHSNIPVISADNDPWSSATSLQIIADLNKLVNSIVTATKEVFEPDTLLLDNASFLIVNSKPMSNTGDSDKTVLRYFLDNNPYINNADQWAKLNTAGVANATRIMAYKRDEEVLALVIPQEFEQLPPQAKSLAFVVPTHSRVGGVRVQYPLALAFMDGTGA